MPRICDAKTPTTLENVLYFGGLVAFVVSFLSAVLCVYALFDAIGPDPTNGDALSANAGPFLRWSAILTVCLAVIGADALLWCFMVEQVAEMWQRELHSYSPDGRPEAVGGTFVGGGVGLILLLLSAWFAPLLLQALGIGSLIAAAACLYRWRAFVAKEEAMRAPAPAPAPVPEEVPQ
ncbi:hypothetical protein HZA87_03935 [Candidatus Uhrbacteria bacterium]|nr:hypothetical protein [Candidatus Uhrbacteria bacterium]